MCTVHVKNMISNISIREKEKSKEKRNNFVFMTTHLRLEGRILSLGTISLKVASHPAY